jgi:hypothetical protein
MEFGRPGQLRFGSGGRQMSASSSPYIRLSLYDFQTANCNENGAVARQVIEGKLFVVQGFIQS